MDYTREETETRTYTITEVVRALNIGTSSGLVRDDVEMHIKNQTLIVTTHKTTNRPHPVARPTTESEQKEARREI